MTARSGLYAAAIDCRSCGGSVEVARFPENLTGAQLADHPIGPIAHDSEIDAPLA